MSKKTKKQKGQLQKPAKDEYLKHSNKTAIVIILTFLGGGVLFASWISQNHFQANWLENRIYLEKTQFLVQIEENRASMWQAQLNREHAAKPRNDTLLMSAAYNYLVSVTTIFAWEKSRVFGGSVAPIEDKELTHARAKQMFEDKDLDGLLNLASIATMTKAKRQNQLNDSFSLQFVDAQQNAEKWNKRFTAYYIAGSLLLGFRWLLVSVYGWPTKREEKQQPGEGQVTDTV